jgi:hypothetical protein
MTFPEPHADNNYLLEHIALLQSSYRKLTGKEIGNLGLQGKDLAKAIFEAPFVVLSHDTRSDPIFTYANLTAQTLFEMDWSELTTLPSRRSAELPNQEERANLLATVTRQGYIENYAGVRISKTGRRFMVQEATVWNLIDEQKKYHRQAAMFSRWQYLSSP